MNPHVVSLLITVPLMAYVVYRRVRGSFGRQPIRTRRMLVRVAILAAVAIGFGIVGLQKPPLLEGLAVGIAGGAALGYLGLRLTRFETTADGDRYVPNPWIGAVLTALVLGRVAYRFIVAGPVAQDAAAQHGPAFGDSPLTLVLLGLTVGYYIAYTVGLLVHHKRWRASLVAEGAV
jgi:hypothetical protein